MRVVLTIRQGDDPKIVENHLYKQTPLEMSFGIIMLAVVDNRPEVLNLKEILQHFIDFRRQVIIRRTQFELKQSEKRLHVLEGLKIALSNVDEVIALIKSALNGPNARQLLIGRFSFSDIQAQAILDMKLQRLTSLETDKIIEEHNQVKQEIERLQTILGSAAEVDKIIKTEITELLE